MGYFNPNISWSDLQRRLTGDATPDEVMPEAAIEFPPIVDPLAGRSR